MPTARKRIQKRTPASVALQIASARQPFNTELAFTENVSLHGIRAVTEPARKLGERVIVQSYHGSVRSRARVIYCHPLAESRYAVATFSGRDMGGRFGTTKSGSVPNKVSSERIQ